MKKKYKCLNLDDYIFPGYEEITGDALYRINGGGRIQPEQNENPPEDDSSNNSDSYTVQSGDTLSQIVYDYNQANGTHLTVDEVAALSGIENPDLIHPGQSIVFSNPEQGGEPGQGSDPTAQGGQNPQSQSGGATPNVESSSSAGSSVPTGQVPNSEIAGNMPFENGVSAEFNPAVNSTSNNQNNIFNATNSNHKSNKQKGNTLADKIAGTLFKFIAPNGINVDMNPENKRQNKFPQQPETKYLYNQKSFDKPLFQASLGRREALIIGYSYSSGIVINRNNLWDSGITLSGGVGIGIEESFNLSTKDFVNKAIDTASSTVDFTKPISTADIEGDAISVYASAGVGVSCDANEGKVKGFHLGAVGGGVYYEKTAVITAGKIAEFLYNTPSFIMNEICKYSGMNKFVKFDYIDLDGR